MDVGRHKHLQQVLMLVPIHPCVKVDAAGIRIEANFLLQLGLHKVPLNGQLGKQGAVGCPLDSGGFRQIPALFGVININIPVVKIDGLVLKYPHPVATGSGLKDLPAILFIEQGGKHSLAIDLRPVIGGFNGKNAVLLRQGKGALRRDSFSLGKGLPALGGHCFRQSVYLALIGLHRLSSKALDPLGKLHQAGSGNARGVEHGDAFSLAGHSLLPLTEKSACFFCQLLILLLGHLIDFFNRGTGENVVELVQQHHLPQFFQLLSGIGHTLFRCQHAQQLQVAEEELALPVAPLVPSHAGIGATVIFKVEFSGPHRQVAVVLHPLFQLFKVLAGTALAHRGDALDALFHPASGFQHLPGGAAAAIAIAIRNQDVIVHLFILIALPAAHNGVRVQHPVIGGDKPLGALAHAQGGDKVGQHLGTVDTLPHHSVVRHHVELVPGELGGHKVVNAALFHNLGQGAGIAEHVRQPQHPVVPAKLLLKEPLAIEELTHQAFSAGEVAVGFQPHTAFRLPAAFGHPLLNLDIQLRIPLFQEAVEHRLAGHELVFRILLHELEHRCEAASHLFTGLGHGPPPGHVNVGVANTAGDDVLIAGHFPIDGFGQQGPGFLHGSGEGLGGHPAHIQNIDSVIEGSAQVHAGLFLGVHTAHGPQGNLDVVIQAIDFRVHLLHFGHETEFRVHNARVGLQINGVSVAGLGTIRQLQLPMVHIGALADFSIHKYQELRIPPIVPLIDLGVEIQPHFPAVKALGHRKGSPEPVMTVFAVPVHGFGIKVRKRSSICVRFFRPQPEALLDFPAFQPEALGNPGFFQLSGNDFRPFFCKHHGKGSP